MARPTAPSLWLPGFDPAPPTLPRTAEQVCLSVSCEPAEPVEVIHVENLSDVEQEQSVVSVRANWRVVATAPEERGTGAARVDSTRPGPGTWMTGGLVW